MFRLLFAFRMFSDISLEPVPEPLASAILTGAIHAVEPEGEVLEFAKKYFIGIHPEEDIPSGTSSGSSSPMITSLMRKNPIVHSKNLSNPEQKIDNRQDYY